MKLNKNSRNILVTGAGSGLGFAVVERLIQNKNNRVFGTALDEKEAKTLQKKFGERFFPIIVDVRNESNTVSAASKLEHLLKGEGLSALMNIAGIVTNGPLNDMTSTDFQNVINVNLIGIHNMCRSVLPLLVKGKGRIVNISSQGGSRTLPFNGVYSASKFGVEALSTAMRLEFYCLGIKVIVVAPAMINTPMATKIQNDLKRKPSLKVYEEPLLRFLAKAENSFRHGIPVEKVADTIIRATTLKNPSHRYDIHQNWWRDYLLMKLLPTKWKDFIFRKTFGL
ncbi:SDR family NAD(P)-dependent oxidoreductase [Leptospira mtsangambouensis]|nr:SDR family NAD(P)-dependent oxidoreductase [Leptospira mtsangambouensis]